MPSHAFLGAGASYSCHLAEDAYSAVARAGARWNCVAHNLSSDSAQGGIPTDQGWNSTPSRLACAPCMGGTSERSSAAVFVATPHLKAACSKLFLDSIQSSGRIVGHSEPIQKRASGKRARSGPTSRLVESDLVRLALDSGRITGKPYLTD